MRQPIDLVNQSGELPSADDLFEALHAVMHLYRGRQYRAQRHDAQALTHMDSKVLGFFARHPGATQKELAAHSGRDKGQLARLVAGLRERGLLEGTPDEADRRNVRLRPTAEGRAQLQALQRQTRRANEQAVAALDAGERRTLAQLLDKLRAGLDDGPAG